MDNIKKIILVPKDDSNFDPFNPESREIMLQIIRSLNYPRLVFKKKENKQE